MPDSRTIPVRLPDRVVTEARAFGKGKTVGESLAIAFCEYLAKNDAELDCLEDEARARRKALAKHPAARNPRPDGGRTFA